MGRRRGAASVIGDALLSIAAAGGALCIALVIGAFAFGLSIMLFKTGSMAPAIPAGSAALVREVPAASVDVGDVVTVDRPGELPITHRIVAIDGSGDERTLTLRGDANPVDDPAPYRVGTVRIVLFSVPGVAGAIAALGHPAVLGGLTVGATALVVWAFWPRTPRGGGRHSRSPASIGGDSRPEADPTRAATGDHVVGTAIAVMLVAVVATLSPAAPAVATTTETVVQGEVIRLTSIGDAAAMGSLDPGESAIWLVGVEADAPSPGAIRMSLAADGPANPFLEVTVTACRHRTADGHCHDESVLVPATPLGGRSEFDLGTMTAADQRWLRVETRLTAAGSPLPVRSVLTVSADGFGESIDTDGDLARSGVDAVTAWPIAAVCLVGAAVLTVARRRRSGP